MSNLYEQDNYIIDSRYVSGRIIEYDIKSANINVLYKAGAIDSECYDHLNRLPKHNREVAIGKMMVKDPNLHNILIDRLRYYRGLLFESNSIKDDEVVRIAKDAVFIRRLYDLKCTEFDGIIFRPKLVAQSMIKLGSILVFSSYNTMDQINIEVRGLGKHVDLHQNGLLVVIANVMYLIDKVSIKDAIRYLQEEYMRYVSYQSPIEYYREFNAFSSYRIAYGNYTTLFIEEKDKMVLDISYNINILREIYSILLELYTKHVRI